MILLIGIDLTKSIFAVYDINGADWMDLVRPAVPHDKLHALIATLPPHDRRR